MDGVITDTESLHRRAELKVCDYYGLKPSRSDWRECHGITSIGIFKILIEKHGQGRTDLDPVKMSDEKIKCYVEMGQEGLPTISGSIEFIGRARDYFEKIALATSSGSAIQKFTFDHHDLWPYFDVVVNANDVTYGKPHPELYMTAAEGLGLPPSDCLVLEDSDNGVRSAVAAGCTTIGITSNFPPEYLTSLGAKTTIDSYDELEERLRSKTLI